MNQDELSKLRTIAEWKLPQEVAEGDTVTLKFHVSFEISIDVAESIRTLVLFLEGLWHKMRERSSTRNSNVG